VRRKRAAGPTWPEGTGPCRVYILGMAHTEETKRKISASMLGKHRPPDVVRKISEGLKRAWAARKKRDAK